MMGGAEDQREGIFRQDEMAVYVDACICARCDSSRRARDDEGERT